MKGGNCLYLTTMKKELTWVDTRPVEHKSYIDESVGKMILRSHDYPDPHSIEWVVTSDVILVHVKGFSRLDRIIPISKIFYIKVVKKPESVKQGLLAFNIVDDYMSKRSSLSKRAWNDETLWMIQFHVCDIKVARKIETYVSEYLKNLAYLHTRSLYRNKFCRYNGGYV